MRVIENKEVKRIGSEKSIKLDIRLIAATNKDLWAMVQENKFREDLYYRLYVFPIYIPALRERKRDIPYLLQFYFNYYVKQLQMDNPPSLTEKNIYQLLYYDWQGNVRQLRHAMERALLSRKSKIHNELDFSFLPNFTANILKKDTKLSKEEIEHILKITHGRIQGKGGAAELLKLHPATLRSRMRVLGIPFSKKDFERKEI